MPELPEVETIKRGLDKLLPGKTVKTVWFDWPKGFPNSQADVDNFLIGAQIKNLERRGKMLVINISGGYSLAIHLKMTGQLVYIKEGLAPPLGSEMNSELSPHPLKLAQSARKHSLPNGLRFGGGHPGQSLVGNLPDKSTRVIFDLEDKKGKARLFFNDQRKFGWIKLLPTPMIKEMEFVRKLGPEPLSPDFTPRDFTLRFKKYPNRVIKAGLLDQSVIAGVGNIYADESLWGAKIHPAQRIGQIPDRKLATLFEELKYVLELSIEKGGSTDRNYVDAKGRKGSYLKFARVFRREGLACPRCGRAILKTRVAGRGTHFCPHCQKIKGPKV
jgi:formamidopyrimidine-DNA glycosylase